MTVSRTKDGVPGWTGDPSTWQEYKQAARLYVASTKLETRYTCGPRLAAELSGAARTAISGKRAQWLSDSQGAETLLSHLQSAIGEPALPEVGNFMRQYFKILKRKRGESMSSFCVRHREEYERMCRALARMLREQGVPSRLGSRGTTGYGVSEGPGSVRGDELEGLRPPEADQVPDTSIAWQVQEWNRDGWYRHYDGPWWGWHQSDWHGRPWYSSGTQSDHWHRPQPAASEIEDDETMIEVLPDAVQGWLLLEKAGLDGLERSVIQGEIKGRFSLKSVENALRSHWNDEQLKKRDGEVKHDIHYQGDEEEEMEPEDYDTSLFEDWSEEERAWFHDAKQEEHQAWMQLQQAKRTLREARNRQHDIRMSRRFYKPGTSPNPGRTVFKGGNNQNMAGKTGNLRDGPCFHCGAMGHKAAVCPKKRREAAQMTEGMEDEMAEFTYFMDDGEDKETQTLEEFLLDKGEVDGEQCFQAQDIPHRPSTDEAVSQGKAVIDGGATKTMGSLHAIECLVKQNKQRQQGHGVQRIATDDQPTFGFGNSQKSKCMSTCVMKVPCDQQPLNMKIHVLDQGKAPILLSVDTLRRLGAVIDYANDLAVFRSLNDRVVVPLERSQAGHQLLPLAEDFLREGCRIAQPIPSLKQMIEE